jgi:hypothetical protein
MWSVGMRDPYESLAVPRSATAADIKKSFRMLAKRLHPDANNSDPKAATLFADLIAAHEILGDEGKRRAFDQGEIDAEGKPKRQAIARRSKPSMSHIVTRLMVVMVMLFITATLIMRGLPPNENVNATSEGEGTVLSAIAANVDNAPGAQVPRLILQQSVSYAAAADSMPLGVQVSDQADNLALEISGLPSGMTISSGRQLGGGGWRILATDVGAATIKPPLGFSGTIDLTVELRLIDDTVVDRGSLHFDWLQKPTAAAEQIESADATPASQSPVDDKSSPPPPTDRDAVRDPTGSGSHSDTDSHPDQEPVDLLIGRSEKLITAGNIEAARTLLRPAAEAHDARAALALGGTYDPIMLAIFQGHEAAADVSLALDWYKKAQEFGSAEAQGRIKLLLSRTAEPKKHVIIHRPPPLVQAPKQAPMAPSDPNGVYVAGTRVGSDPDPNIRAQLLRDDAGRQLRTTPNGVAEGR